ncbi:MAG: EutN/CcmL family microcompartment protein, partial [Microcoleus sp. T1-bin1]|nr:EutN/CcmL family microcompartment protein [Microcoleus sp. T1-bin1]
MQMAKVLGTVVSTQKEPTLRGSKFLLLQFID